MTKEEWIAAADAKLLPYGIKNSREYAESLHETYAEDGTDLWVNDPEGAVLEDVSYWGD